MKNLSVILLSIILLSFCGCSKDFDDSPQYRNSVNSFVYDAMQLYYLYKADVPELAQNITGSTNYNQLVSNKTPKELFDKLLFEKGTTDRFSVIVDNYFALEALFAGNTNSTGLRYSLYDKPNSTNLYGVVNYVAPNSPAATAGLTRGMVFTQIDNQNITDTNFKTLFGQDSFTLHMADFVNSNPITNNTTIALTKLPITENPIFISKTITQNNKKIGYLMYNQFIANYNSALNNAFADLQLNNITELVLDLRYNPGGSVNTATLLGSLISGKNSPDTFSKIKYNNDLGKFNKSYTFLNSVNGNVLNKVSINRVYILTSQRTASASEMMINSLRPYMEVVHIGETTKGKFQASVTLYDSVDFRRNNVNPAHTYALQPLVAKTTNSIDAEVPNTGLVPSITYSENPENLGVLGDVNEPLLKLALNHINANSLTNNLTTSNKKARFNFIDETPLLEEMRIE